MLAIQAFERLTTELRTCIAAMDIRAEVFGAPQVVRQQAQEAERLFQGYAKAKPNKEDAYAAALAFLRGQVLDDWQHDVIASALAEPIREQFGKIVLEDSRLHNLFKRYLIDAKSGELWRLTWHGLLTSYFAVDLDKSPDPKAMEGWNELRKLLLETWPYIDKQAGHNNVPDWVALLRQESSVLSDYPADKYALDYLAGNTTPVERIAADLGIPASSWFWHSLVLGAIRKACEKPDEEFRALIPRLLQLIDGKPAFRDLALEQVLVRYHSIKGAEQEEHLRDYVVQSHVWKNPKLRSAGIATAWNRVPESVWLMVLGWVNERNLKDFFDILAARNQADAGRLAFWSMYMKQISWTRLVFGADTMALKNRNAEVRNLIAREEGAYAQLTANRDVDAFMMQIGGYIVVEFSKKPNAAYVYSAARRKFNFDKSYYTGGTADLKSGFYDKSVLRITHNGSWAQSAANELKLLGIVPDKLDASAEDYLRQTNLSSHPVDQHITVEQVDKATGFSPNSPIQSKHSAITPNARDAVPKGAPFTMTELRTFLSPYPSAKIIDSRGTPGGRFYVEDSAQRVGLEAELLRLGFKFSPVRGMWYFPEN